MSTVAIDFDGVIHAYTKGWQDGTIYDPPAEGAFPALMTLMDRYAVYVHTTRPPGQVAQWIEQQSGYTIECVTRMHPFLPTWWRWGKPFRFWNTRGLLLISQTKLPAIAYIDDRAVHHTGDWTATLDAVAEFIGPAGAS